MSKELLRVIENDPEFIRLRRARDRVNWTMAVVMLIAYFSFIGVIAYQPALLAIPLHDDTVITWGIPVGFSIIVLSLVLIGVYVTICNRVFDPALRTVLSRARNASTDD